MSQTPKGLERAKYCLPSRALLVKRRGEGEERGRGRGGGLPVVTREIERSGTPLFLEFLNVWPTNLELFPSPFFKISMSYLLAVKSCQTNL